MFESLDRDDAAQRLRAAALPPLAAFLIALVYLTVYPLLPRVPALLFWTIAAILLAGAILGAIKIVRVRNPAIGWLVVAIAMELVCVWLLLSLTLPWLGSPVACHSEPQRRRGIPCLGAVKGIPRLRSG